MIMVNCVWRRSTVGPCGGGATLRCHCKSSNVPWCVRRLPEPCWLRALPQITHTTTTESCHACHVYVRNVCNSNTLFVHTIIRTWGQRWRGYYRTVPTATFRPIATWPIPIEIRHVALFIFRANCEYVLIFWCWRYKYCGSRSCPAICQGAILRGHFLSSSRSSSSSRTILSPYMLVPGGMNATFSPFHTAAFSLERRSTCYHHCRNARWWHCGDTRCPAFMLLG